MESTMAVTDFEMFVEDLDHPECVAWGPDGFVYAGGEAGQIYKITLDGETTEEIGSTNGFVLGICLDGDANVYACDPGNGAVMRVTPAGEVSTYATGSEEHRFINPNYPVFDDAGNLYVSDSGGFHEDNGSVWVIRPGGAVELISDALVEFPNGVALSPAHDYLYIAMSTIPGVSRIPVRKGAAVGKPELVVELEKAIPDGLAFDIEGNLYVSCYTPDVIYKLTPSGALSTFAYDWERVTLASPTNIAFGGADNKTLLIASLCRWHLSKGQVPIAGQPLHYPRLGG